VTEGETGCSGISNRWEEVSGQERVNSLCAHPQLEDWTGGWFAACWASQGRKKAPWWTQFSLLE